MESYFEGERNPDVEAQTTPYDPVVMIGLPVLGLPGSGDAFVLQQMKESDRRLLDDFLSSNVSTNDYVLEFIGHKDEDDNGPGYMFKPELTLNQSFIGRVNLSEDPNPTSISRSLAAVRRSEPDYHVRPVVDEKENYKAFLDLVKAASETNSGGYVLRLAGWPNAESRQIWLSLRCTGSSFEGKLASFASRLVTFDTGHAGGATAPSAPLALRETAKQVAAVGEPGVFCLQVKRPNSDRLFRDPSSRSVRRRTLTREQALNIMESEDGLPAGHMVDRDRRNVLPADTLDRAGGREVDMAKRFNLLQVQIVDSNDFNPLSNRHDLPTGPEKPGADPTDDYVYSWSVPAYSLAKAPANDLYPKEQPNDPFIYAAIDRSMEVRASFRDVLGFSPDSADDFQGVLTGKYFDPIVSLLSLSGLRVSHRVTPGNGKLEIRLHFTPAAIKGEVRDDARILSIRAQYARAMQQVRDANTTYYVESSLGLRNGEGAPTRKALTPQQRERLYRDLKRCRNVLDRLANGQDVAAINLTSLTFAQTGAPPAGGVTRYQVRWLAERRAALVWPEVAAIRRSKVVSIASDIPLFASKDDADACEVLASAIAAAFNGAVLLSYTRDGRNEETLYLVDGALTRLTIADGRVSPAFAAMKPLSTKPYAKAKATVWNWQELKRPPADDSPGDDWSEAEISGFDQDASFTDLLRDIDLTLTPLRAAEVWSASSPADVKAFKNVLAAKRRIAEAAPRRVISIRKDDDDIQVVAACKEVIQRNLQNSFKKRLARIADVDTILVIPFTYSMSPTDVEFLLYGSVKVPARTPRRVRNEGDETEPQKRASKFLPAALRRVGKENHLIIQFDAGQPATRENYISPLSFVIEHIRWDVNGDESPYGARWLKLFHPVETPLAPNGAYVNIPVLFKRLLNKPDISTAELGQWRPTPGASYPLDLAIKLARQWAFRFDVERTRAATQDDVRLDVLYNNRPPDPTYAVRFRSAGRELGVVLFEYARHKLWLQESGGPSLWLQALAHWGDQVALSLESGKRAAATREGSDLKSVEQNFTLLEDMANVDGSDKLRISLKKRGNWRHGPFGFTIDEIKPEKQANGEETASNPGAPRAIDLAVLDIDPPISNLDEGEYYSGRRIGILNLDILNFENAWPAAQTLRNATLGDYVDVQEDFVYSTDRVHTGEPLTPFLDIDFPIDLPGGSLNVALKALFDELLKDVDEENWPLIELSWGFDSGQLDPYKDESEEDDGMKVFGKDPIGMFSPRKLSSDYATAIAIVVESLGNWEALNGGSPQNGRYVFELRVFSRLESVDKPLLRLSDLRLKLPV